MPAINFQSQFAAKVEAGTKNQTIRKARKLPIKVGDTLQLFTGQRTKDCRKLKVVTCTGVEPVKMYEHVEQLSFGKNVYYRINVNGTYLDGKWIQYSFALQDGFKDIGTMFDWFEKTHGLPFTGVLIKWG